MPSAIDLQLISLIDLLEAKKVISTDESREVASKASWDEKYDILVDLLQAKQVISANEATRLFIIRPFPQAT